MRPCTMLALAVMAVLATAVPAAATPPATASKSASARLTSCDPDARRASFSADMRSLPGAARLQLRFTLHVLDGGSWQPVDAPSLGAWMTAAPGRTRYMYDKRVENLQAGSYRMHVRFRWRAAEGQVIRAVTRRTHACRVPDPRPDLAPTRVDVGRGPTDDTREYRVIVANTGRGAAGPFEVALTVDGVPLTDQAVEGLRAGDVAVVRFAGPACATGGTLVASIDASGLVDEADEADDSLSVPCSGA